MKRFSILFILIFIFTFSCITTHAQTDTDVFDTTQESTDTQDGLSSDIDEYDTETENDDSSLLDITALLSEVTSDEVKLASPIAKDIGENSSKKAIISKITGWLFMIFGVVLLLSILFEANSDRTRKKTKIKFNNQKTYSKRSIEYKRNKMKSKYKIR